MAEGFPAADLAPLLGAFARDGRPEAGAVAALTAGLAAGLVASATADPGLRAQAAALVARANRLAHANARHHGAAVDVLAGVGDAPDPRGVLEAAGTTPLLVAALAADVALLAATVAAGAGTAVAPDAVGAAELAAGAAAAAGHLVAVNLVLRGEPGLQAEVADRVEAAREAARNAAAAAGQAP